MADFITPFIDALCAILGADAAIAARMGRASAGAGAASAGETPYCLPWSDPAVGAVVPVLLYQKLSAAPWGATRSQRVRLRLTALAPDPATADGLLADALAACTPQAFDAAGVDACLDPASTPLLVWPPHTPAADDPARARSDVDVAFYVTP